MLPEEPIQLWADPHRLAQVLCNLLHNAAKFTPQGGRVELEATLDGAEVCIAVRDNGRGIAPTTLPSIFELFSQAAGSLEEGSSGLGIGLTLVRSLVELHGGRVEAHSEGIDMGSEFRVRLPVHSPSQPPASEHKEEHMPAETENKRLLVVDDNRDAADSLSLMLGMLGNDVKTAYDGLEALELAEHFRPDTVLLDIGMPKLNGYETAKRLRAEPWGREVTLVALTGWGQESDKQRTREAGFDHHLVKPVELAQLQKVLAGEA